MTSGIAILTWNRLPVLKTFLDSLQASGLSERYPIAVFDDQSLEDDTCGFLGGSFVGHRSDLKADEWTTSTASAPSTTIRAFLGTENLGVSGNSNRALRFAWEQGWDHICLCNDDLVVSGDFVRFYAEAHSKLGVGMWCYCGLTDESHRWVTIPYNDYKIKMIPRMTGAMMSITRDVIKNIGYFDTRFGKFGEEHCDYTNRARFSGFINLGGQEQQCLDVDQDFLKHQDTPSSISAKAKPRLDAEAAAAIQEASCRYATTSHYRPFRLRWPRFAGTLGQSCGIRVDDLTGYALF